MVSSAFNENRAFPEIPSDNSSAKPAEKADAPYPWVISPVLDFVFIYGGVFWLMCVMHVMLFGFNAANLENLKYHVGGPVDWGVSQWWVLMAMVTPVLINNTHTWATYMRIYGSTEDRERFKFYGRYLIWAPLILFVSALIYPPLQGWVVYVHMGWVFQHYTSQTYGVGLIYCYKRNYVMSAREKQIYKLLLASISGYVITQLACMREAVPADMWGVPLPFLGLPREIHTAAVGFLIVMSVMFTGMVIVHYFKHKRMMPFPTLTMTLGVALLGMATDYGSLIAWLWAPPFLHGAQYCLISLSYYLKEKGLPNGWSSADISKALLTKPAIKWMAWAIIGGNFIYVVIPHIMADFGWSFMAIVSVVQGCVNFHHFLTDGAIWKLRDAKTRQLLIS
ncbi:hypothetical protein KF707_16890 [Candidatus Obscuribacterales bacterium]|nr:hypothetical protein [Candidatus Obscuribacterales bacterium]MBX3149874.1 hypothetical protein [Candidatus Obscuribacterales bacterium]